MKRFSISVSDSEYEMIERMQRWYSGSLGVKVSKCRLIKALLFNICDFKSLIDTGSPRSPFKNDSNLEK
mgnify:FL=1